MWNEELSQVKDYRHLDSSLTSKKIKSNTNWCVIYHNVSWWMQLTGGKWYHHTYGKWLFLQRSLGPEKSDIMLEIVIMWETFGSYIEFFFSSRTDKRNLCHHHNKVVVSQFSNCPNKLWASCASWKHIKWPVWIKHPFLCKSQTQLPKQCKK